MSDDLGRAVRDIKKMAALFDGLIRSGNAETLDLALSETLDTVVGAYKLARRKGFEMPLLRQHGYN